jgi:RNA polymerase sigma-70 factor (ECF subfamily)
VVEGAVSLRPVDRATRRTYTWHVEDGSAAGGVTGDGDGAPDAGAGNLPSRPSQRARVDHVAEETALASARAGRPGEAVKILMRAYGGHITAFAIRILRESESAKDVRQQVFLEAFQGLRKFKGHSSLWTWLCGITYHRCLDELRRKRRSGGVEDLDMLDRIVGRIDSAMDVDQVAERRALERCLAKLSETMRSQLLMRCFLGLSYMEIGETIDAPHSTVQVRISRILPRLRRCLRGEGVVR